MYNWKCECGKEARKLQEKPEAPTCDCGKPMQRDIQPPTAQVMETLDNGFMARRVVRPADAERLYKERAANDPRLKKDDVI